ncbi:MAG: sporulation protein YabP [Clostridia bacterium]|nr:sporulation protein YabP [Clostridia bacterium]
MNTEATKDHKNMSHRITLNQRESMELNGVTDVISFDEQTVVLSTVCGDMAIEGSALHIHVLSIEQGIVTLDGRIDSVTYYERETAGNGERHGFFGRLFH